MVRRAKDNSGAAIAPFLTKCYEMVDDRSTDEVISWGESSNSFLIRDTARLTLELLPKYFKHNNFSSFMRQLNIYGFRKIDSDRWEFANDAFIRGQEHLLKNIVRRKHVQGLDQQKPSLQNDSSARACEEVESNVLLKEVESLKNDKNAVMHELSRLRQLHETSENKVLLLGERLRGMEKNQQQMLSFLVMAMQSPALLVQLLQPKESNWRMPEAGKNMLQEVTRADESAPSDGMIVKFQPRMDIDEIPDPKESVESGFSPDKAKDFFMNVDFLSRPLDEQFIWSENHGPLSLPDLAEDSLLKQMLLEAPFLEKHIGENPDGQEPTDPDVEQESATSGPQLEKFRTIESLTEEMEKFEQLDSGERSQNLDLLTEQLGRLISETSA